MLTLSIVIFLINVIKELLQKKKVLNTIVNKPHRSHGETHFLKKEKKKKKKEDNKDI